MSKKWFLLFGIIIFVATIMVTIRFTMLRNTGLDPKKTILKEFGLNIDGKIDNVESKKVKKDSQTITLIKIEMSKELYDKILPEIKRDYWERTDPGDIRDEGNVLKGIWNEYYHLSIDDEFSSLFGRYEMRKEMSGTVSCRRQVDLYIGVNIEKENVILFFCKID